MLYFTASTPSLYFVYFPTYIICCLDLFTDRIRTEKCLYDLYRPYGSSNRSPVAQVTHSIPHNEMQFSDCIRTENCLFDLSNRTDREAVFSDRISLSIRTDREAVFSDRISLSILDMTEGKMCFQ